MSFVSAGQGGVDNGDGTVTWSVDPANQITPDQTATFDLRLKVEDADQAPFTNTAEISADSGNDIDSTPDTNPANDPMVDHNDIDHKAPYDDRTLDEDDQDIATVDLLPYDLALVKTLANGQSSQVNGGDNVDFTLTVKNQGDVSSGAYAVTDTLPGGTSFVSADQGGVDNGTGPSRGRWIPPTSWHRTRPRRSTFG